MSRLSTLAERGAIDFTRQRDFYDPTRRNSRVTVVGCGGIGSPTALALAKLGIERLTLCDHDRVEPHNLPNQFFQLNAVGKSKVEAMKETLTAYAPGEVVSHNGRLTDTNLALSGIVVAALDSMSARKELYGRVKGFKGGCELLIDCRLGGELIAIYAVRPYDLDDCRLYEATLYSDEEAVDLPCTARAVIDVGLMAASLITNVVRKYLAGKKVPTHTYLNAKTLVLFAPDMEACK